jgi:hypothetical protein
MKRSAGTMHRPTKPPMDKDLYWKRMRQALVKSMHLDGHPKPQQ